MDKNTIKYILTTTIKKWLMWIVVLPYFGLTFRYYDDIWRYIFESLKICLEKPKKITMRKEV